MVYHGNQVPQCTVSPLPKSSLRDRMLIAQTWTAADDFAEDWLAENIGPAEVMYLHHQTLPLPSKTDRFHRSTTDPTSLGPPQTSASLISNTVQVLAPPPSGTDTMPLSAHTLPLALTQSLAHPVVDIESTSEHRRNMRRLCPAEIGRYYRRDPYYCMKHQNLHVCVDYAGNGCSHGGPGVVHLGSIHTFCRSRGSRDCKKPGCCMPTGINVLHTKYSCYTYRYDPLNPVCPRGGP